MKSGHDYRGEVTAAGRRMRRSARWLGTPTARAFDAYTAKCDAYNKWFFGAMQKALAKAYRGVEVLKPHPLLGMARPRPLRVPLGEMVIRVRR